MDMKTKKGAVALLIAVVVAVVLSVGAYAADGTAGTSGETVDAGAGIDPEGGSIASTGGDSDAGAGIDPEG